MQSTDGLSQHTSCGLKTQTHHTWVHHAIRYDHDGIGISGFPGLIIAVATCHPQT